ncbi:pentapeptide repeat-containing protein [Haloferax prahovense DSM 18310]|uniref:Pentapeptide repeat-containing protein n=2 Tax=Haloferax prahovense TaxID=381852 RepID=M0GAN4_HALPT|nr:pentapeptide repeat-containing protein [Haloferax prahovense DSM 18310]
MRSTDLRFGSLLDAVVKGVDLTGGDLRDTDMMSCDLEASVLIDTNLRATNFTDSSLRKANLTGSDLEGAELSNTDLAHATLDGVNLSRTQIRRSNLQNISAFGADFSQKDLTGNDFTSADIRNADLNGSELEDIDFKDANLYNADLSSANLQRAKFHRAELVDADFTGSDLRGTTFSSVDIRGIRFDGVDLSGDTKFYGFCSEPTNAQEWNVLAEGYEAVRKAFRQKALDDTHRELYYLQRKARTKEASKNGQWIKYLGNLTSQGLTGYGVRVSYVLIWTVLLLASSTAWYSLVGTTGSWTGGSLFYSVSTLVTSAPHPPKNLVPWVPREFTDIVVLTETYVGTLLIVLLGYVLGNRDTI